MLDHFLVRIRGAELRIRFHTMRQPPGLIPARFPKIGRTGSFRFAERWKKRLGSRFYQECARAKNKNGNSFMSSFEDGDLGREALRIEQSTPYAVARTREEYCGHACHR